MATDDQKAIDKLRQIFLSDYLYQQEELAKKIEEIEFKISDRDSLLEKFNPLISELIRKNIIESEEEFINIISPIMGKSIKKQIDDSKDDVIDAIYPIMGQVIKKSVSESIKEFYQTINRKIDNALRKGIFSSKIKSKISGVSTSDILLKNALPFGIKEVFLIYEKSGLLISHVSKSDNNHSADADLVSGMLTAIKDFVTESFRSDSGEENLYEIQYGDSKIVLERGKYIYLAIVFYGSEPDDFQEKLTLLSNNIHTKYHEKLRDFSGNIEHFKDSNLLINNFIDTFQPREKKIEDEPVRPVLLYLVTGIIVLFLILFGSYKVYEFYQEKTIDEQIENKLTLIPDLNLDEMKWSINKGEVTLTGNVSSEEIKNLVENSIYTISGVESVDSRLGIIFRNVHADSIAQNVVSIIEKEQFSNVSFQVIEDKIILSGNVESENEKISLGYLISKVPGVRVVINNLVPNQFPDVSDKNSIALIKRLKLYFEFDESDLSNFHLSKLDSIIPFLKRNLDSKLVIKGFSDQNGSNESRLLIANIRADRAKKYLVSRGVMPAQLTAKGYISQYLHGSFQKFERKVEFELVNED